MTKAKEEEKPKDERQKKVYSLLDTIYYFNPFTEMVSVYELRRDGFTYCSTRYAKDKYDVYENTVRVQCVPGENKPIPKGREITLLEFSDFIEKLEVLQEQAHAFKPLVTFDDYVKVITQTHQLRLKE